MGGSALEKNRVLTFLGLFFRARKKQSPQKVRTLIRGKSDNIIAMKKPKEPAMGKPEQKKVSETIKILCDKCNNIFKTNKELMKHKGDHHVGTKRKDVVQPPTNLQKNKDSQEDTDSDTEEDKSQHKFDCNICGKQLYANSKGVALKTMITHKRNEHNMEVEALNISRVCDTCGFSSKSEAHLKHHRRDDHLIKSESMSPPYKKKKDDGQKEVSELLDAVLEQVTSMQIEQVETKPVELEVQREPSESYEERRFNARFSEVEKIDTDTNQMKEEEDIMLKVIRQNEEKAVRMNERFEREAAEHEQTIQKKAELENNL